MIVLNFFIFFSDDEALKLIDAESLSGLKKDKSKFQDTGSILFKVINEIFIFDHDKKAKVIFKVIFKKESYFGTINCVYL